MFDRSPKTLRLPVLGVARIRQRIQHAAYLNNRDNVSIVKINETTYYPIAGHPKVAFFAFQLADWQSLFLNNLIETAYL